MANLETKKYEKDELEYMSPDYFITDDLYVVKDGGYIDIPVSDMWIESNDYGDFSVVLKNGRGTLPPEENEKIIDKYRNYIEACVYQMSLELQEELKQQIRNVLIKNIIKVGDIYKVDVDKLKEKYRKVYDSIDKDDLAIASSKEALIELVKSISICLCQVSLNYLPTQHSGTDELTKRTVLAVHGR